MMFEKNLYFQLTSVIIAIFSFNYMSSGKNSLQTSILLRNYPKKLLKKNAKLCKIMQVLL